jgi:hypothetical protein
MPAPTRTARSSILAVTAGLLVAGVLAVPGSATASDADQPTLPPPPSYAGHLARAGGGDIGNPGYHYAVAHTQVLPTKAAGLRATLSVHHPRQVRGRMGQHSLGQIAVGQRADASYLEAGWRQSSGRPRLFAYWRPANGGDTCYNFGCGFRPQGPGLRPGAVLQPGTEITVAFQHIGHRWWLKVDGRKSGYYPDRLWRGRFTGTDFAQLYGEVYTAPHQRVCADMGSGQPARNAHAAYMKDARWIGGPALQLEEADTVREVHRYSYLQTSRNSFRYGGPGVC